MKIQFSFKETKQFCSLPNLGQYAITTTYLGHKAINLNFWAILQNFWGHFVKTQKSTTSCNYTRTQNLINAKTSLKDQTNLSFSVFGPKRKNVNFWAKVQIHKSIKTLCNCIKAPKVLPLREWPVLGEDKVGVCVDLWVLSKSIMQVYVR